MISQWNILAPIDLSRPSDEDVAYALCVAEGLNAHLHLLYVSDSVSDQVGAKDWPFNALTGELSGRSPSRSVLTGPAATTIAGYADAVDANAVLMPSRRYGRWKRLWKRSVTEEVMRLSHRPVIVTSASATDGDFSVRNHRILCLVGLDDRETTLVRNAEELASRTTSDLVLVHVVPEASEALLYHAIDGGCRPLSRERATAELTELAHSLRLPAETSVCTGQPEKCIALAVRERPVDLVMMSRARGEWRAAYGSDLAGTLSRLQCPLLTVPVDAPVSGMNSRMRGARQQQTTNRTALAAPRRRSTLTHQSPAVTFYKATPDWRMAEGCL